MGDNKVTDKHENVINPGDYVGTKIRGGTHEGHVCKSWQLVVNFLGLYSVLIAHMFRWKR